jgi:hypothetical protein
MPIILPKTVQIAILRRDGWLCPLVGRGRSLHEISLDFTGLIIRA